MLSDNAVGECSHLFEIRLKGKILRYQQKMAMKVSEETKEGKERPNQKKTG